MDKLSYSRLSRIFARNGGSTEEQARLRVGLLVAAVFLLGTAALYLRASADAAIGAAQPLTVETLRVVYEEAYTFEQQYAGRVEAQRETRLAFERAGLVTDVRVEEGQSVAGGDVIATMDIEQLQAQRDRLEADRANAQAQLDLARLTTDRQGALAKEGFSSTQRFDDARLSASALEASVASITAAIRSIDIDIEKSVLRAPYDGVVGARFVDDGTVINAGSAVADVLETGVVQARIGLPPAVANSMVVGQSYRLTYRDRAHTGRLIAVRPDLEAQTQTVAALFVLDDAPQIPIRGVVHFSHSQTELAVGTWLPLAALVEGEKGLWSVFVVQESDDENIIGRESVEIIHIEDNRVYVRGTLRSGAQVLIGGVNRVAPGQRVALAGG
ncbi:MAG: efflux RND transporter periplasmic adaptor subunit [Rhodospirillaceae bacterium]